MSGFEIKSVTSKDGELFFRELLGENVGAVPTDNNGFFGKFERIDVDGLRVGFVRSRGRLAMRRSPRPDRIMLMFSQPGNGAMQANGREFPSDAICVVGTNGDIGMSLPNPANLVFVEIPVEQWQAASGHTANQDLLESFVEGVKVLRSSGGLPTLISAVTQMRRAVATRNPLSSDTDAATRGALVVASAVKAVTVRSNIRARLTASRHLLHCFNRAMKCVEDHLPDGLTVSELCAATGIHERTLQVASRSILDMTPGQYIRYRRLAACRRKLVDSYPEEVTVGAVAMEFGFLYPSQFAAYYGKAFGEKPSVTLRRNPGHRMRKVRERSVGWQQPGRLQFGSADQRR